MSRRDQIDKEDSQDAQSFQQKEAVKVEINPFEDLPGEATPEEPAIETETEVVE